MVLSEPALAGYQVGGFQKVPELSVSVAGN
jgi:hypothetical protein